MSKVVDSDAKQYQKEATGTPGEDAVKSLFMQKFEIGTEAQDV